MNAKSDTKSKSSSIPSDRLRGRAVKSSSKPRISNQKGNTGLKSSVAVSKRFSSDIVELLPSEVLILIFSYLDASDLLVCARVCRKWLHIANDNVVWQRMYEKYLLKTKTGKDLGIPLEVPTLFWKRSCLEKSVEFRNGRAYSKLKSVDPYTLLLANTANNLQEIGVVYTLAFLDGSGTHHYIRHSECFYHRMSVSARWYKFDDLPPLNRISSIKLLALNPVFYDQKGQACKNSPCQRSLLREYKLDWSRWVSSNQAASCDSAVSSYIYADGLLISVWKDGGGLAYIAANLHYYQLIDRCLKGTFKEAHHLPKLSAVMRDPIDSRYGLQGYKATVELRNLRQSIWSSQFRHLDSKGSSCELVGIDMERADAHTPVERGIELPWKTELFKNKTPNLCILDVTLSDEHGRHILYISDFVQALPNQTERFSYVYEGQGSIITHNSEKCQISVTIDKDGDKDKLVISSVIFRLPLTFVNSVFGTRYN